jgi:hypothetical protein
VNNISSTLKEEFYEALRRSKDFRRKENQTTFESLRVRVNIALINMCSSLDNGNNIIQIKRVKGQNASSQTTLFGTGHEFNYDRCIRVETQKPGNFRYAIF